MAFNLQAVSREQASETPRIILYGVEGIGKSTLAASIPDALYLPTEKPGALNAAFAFGLDDKKTPVLAQSLDQIMEVIKALATEEHDYKMLIVDSISGVERLIHKDVCANYVDEKTGAPAPLSAIGEAPFQRGFEVAMGPWARYVRGVEALAESGVAIMQLGHAAVEKFPDPQGDAYERYVLRVHKKARDLLVERSSDMLFANYLTVTNEIKEGFGKRNIGVGTGKRKLYTSERPAYKAKNRWDMPASIDFSWSAIVEQMQKQA